MYFFLTLLTFLRLLWTAVLPAHFSTYLRKICFLSLSWLRKAPIGMKKKWVLLFVLFFFSHLCALAFCKQSKYFLAWLKTILCMLGFICHVIGWWRKKMKKNTKSVCFVCVCACVKLAWFTRSLRAVASVPDWQHYKKTWANHREGRGKSWFLFAKFKMGFCTTQFIWPKEWTVLVFSAGLPVWPTCRWIGLDLPWCLHTTAQSAHHPAAPCLVPRSAARWTTVRRRESSYWCLLYCFPFTVLLPHNTTFKRL